MRDFEINQFFIMYNNFRFGILKFESKQNYFDFNELPFPTQNSISKPAPRSTTEMPRPFPFSLQLQTQPQLTQDKNGIMKVNPKTPGSEVGDQKSKEKTDKIIDEKSFNEMQQTNTFAEGNVSIRQTQLDQQLRNAKLQNDELLDQIEVLKNQLNQMK